MKLEPRQMALTILNRPEKTLDNGYLSRWNASRTPLQYKFISDLFPVNTVDFEFTITNYAYSSSKRGTAIFVNAAQTFANGEYIKIEGTGDIDGIHKVKESVNSTEFIIDLFTSATGSTGTAQKYYKGYKALVNVYAGSPEYHPYNSDGSKPQLFIGTIQVEFDNDNEGVCNVRSFIKPDMSADFDYDDENSHHAWTSFYIEYAEIWDGSDAPTFEEDILDNCTPFVGFSNESFDNGLTDWQLLPSDIVWTVGTSEIIANGLGGSGQRETDKVTQDIELRANIPYQIEINYNLVSGTVSDNITIIILAKPVGFSEQLVYASYNTPLGVGLGIVDYTPTNDIEYLGIQVFTTSSNPSSFEFRLEYFQVTTSVLNQCKYSSFATFGAKQFQDSLGGNFGDYIASRDTQGKLLTHFEELKYPFYVNSIIPNSTFNQSEGGDSVFLEAFLYDNQGNEVEYVKQQIQNKSDGVYTVNPVINSTPNEWSKGTVQLVSIPNNLLLDGDNGTYDNGNPLSWGVFTYVYDPLTPNYIGGTIISAIIEGEDVGGFNSSAPSMLSSDNPFLLFRFDTDISIQIGETYIIETDVYINGINFEPSQRGNSSFYLGIEGYNDDDLTIVKAEVPNNADDIDALFKVSTTFVATTDTVKIVMKNTIKTDINNGTGGVFFLNNTTFKGPVEYLTEKKPIKTGVGCGFKELLLRWKNDLGGWEKWNFSRFGTFKENVKDKVNIKRDITQDWDNYFINGDTQYDTISQNVRQLITVRSELLTEDEQKNLNQIRRSIRVQAFINNKWVTVTVVGGSYELYDENEKVREVSFDIQLPETLTQEQ